MRIARLAALLAVAALVGTAHAATGRRRAPRPACTGSCSARTSREHDASRGRRRSPGTPSPARTATSSSSRRAARSATTASVYNANNADDAGRGAADHAAVDHRLTLRALRTGARDHADGATPWSANFGFDMVPPPAPTPLPSYPGLLRWTPVEGADAYEVWLVDVLGGKMETVRTNVLDEREFYTFHQSASWIGTVRWRIRAIRSNAARRPVERPPGRDRTARGARSTARRTPPRRAARSS